MSLLKRPSRRRWKARALRGQMVPWAAVVEHRLEKWGEWERRHDYMDAYLLNVLSEASFEGARRKWVLLNPPPLTEKAPVYYNGVWWSAGT